MPLTAKQQRFIQEYLIDSNATQAAIRAGYSAKTAAVQAHDLLRKPNIAEAVAEGRAALAKAAGVTAERIMAEYARIGFADMRKLFDANGNLLHPRFMDDDTAAAVAEVEVSKKPAGETIHKIKRVDKKGALDSMARVLGMFQDKVATTVDGTLNIEIVRFSE